MTHKPKCFIVFEYLDVLMKHDKRIVYTTLPTNIYLNFPDVNDFLCILLMNY